VNDDDIAAVCEVLRGDWLTQGPLVERFEQALAEYLGVGHVVVFASGTAALHGAFYAAGLKHGDRVLTSPLTFAATANAALYVGADPVFADIDYGTLCLDPLKADRKLAETPRVVKAIVPVSYAGYPFDITPFMIMARENGAILIEDACHAIGGSRENFRGDVKKIGFDADMTAFSFHPVKNITTGEGGAVATNISRFARRLQLFRSHGITRNHAEFKDVHAGPWHSEMRVLGYNYRLSEIHCALGLSQLKRLDSFVERRREIAGLYRQLLSGVRGVYQPPAATGHAYHLFPIRVPAEDRLPLFNHLAARDITPQVHYRPVHLQPYYRERFGYKTGDFPEAESFYDGALSLPMYPSLTDEDVEHVATGIREYFENI
jgi:UDP-4-amino-4,6-dideoxy-N-acetyl-beta-L-altrosamine transaminase